MSESPEIPEFLREAMAASAELQAGIERFDAMIEADAAEARAAEEHRAKEARSGAMGPAWKVIQQRIDLNQTTLADVFSGADESAAARELRQAASTRFRRLHEEWTEQEESAEAEPTPLREGARLHAEAAEDFTRHMADLQASLVHIEERLRRLTGDA